MMLRLEMFFNWLIGLERYILLVCLNMLRFVEGDFDTYIKQIQQPNEWGGEPELLMASHVLKYVP